MQKNKFLLFYGNTERTREKSEQIKLRGSIKYSSEINIPTGSRF
jgi:hypothetical protein